MGGDLCCKFNRLNGKRVERPFEIRCAISNVEASGASTASKAKAHLPARRSAHEKTEQPKRKETRRKG
jgi:hypothetical protein